MAVVNNSVYVGGERIASPDSLAATYEHLREGNAMAWIAIDDPDEREVHSLGEAFDLHALLLEDMLTGHQRPKLERYDGVVFVVLTTTTLHDATGELVVGEVHVVLGPRFAITIRRAQSPDLEVTRARLEGDRELFALGPSSVLYVVADQVVDDHAGVVEGLDNDIDDVEDDLFAGRESAERIYALSRRVMQLQRATRPLPGIFETLARRPDDYGAPQGLREYFRDVDDHAIHVLDRAETLRSLLDNALNVNLAHVGKAQNDASLAQNDQMKKISSWAAIFFAPSLVASIYGMNFRYMPVIIESRWGFIMSLVIMVAGGGVLYVIFKWNKWL
ncbi:magnesium and cobalt transport protein CorA [Georgenia wutianyii]|uniref:Magnesium and cobalt transport protein CorA n=1 Tax=Georgenia wutianyii TaxID=2585135 RepID=A0ABX5VPG0_9MICO|nr:magnesium and cobalt transport protein CorA [Georgenia wutianyii]QDB79716.1 magnesium and cobalt transport protein CorA [Georgenia wutianyii]